jgi:hypothetical protein
MTTKLFKIIKKEIQPDPHEADLYEILPRFLDEETPYVEERFLKPVQRDFEWEDETFQLYINPASVEDEDEKYRQYFPGNQEAEIEMALIELAARTDDSLFDAKKFAFTLRQLQNHLTTSGYQYSREQIKHSILILAGVAYMILGKDIKWIFRTIETLALTEDETDIQFLAYFGVLISNRIKKQQARKS